MRFGTRAKRNMISKRSLMSAFCFCNTSKWKDISGIPEGLFVLGPYVQRLSTMEDIRQKRSMMIRKIAATCEGKAKRKNVVTVKFISVALLR